MSTTKGMFSVRLTIAAVIIFCSIAFVLIFPTIDLDNIRNFLYSTSFLVLSQTPYFHAYNYTIATPPFFFSLLLPSYYIYTINWDIFNAFLILRVLNVIFTLSTAWVLSLIVGTITKSQTRKWIIFYTFMVSPFIVFINYVYGEQSIFGIFLTVSAFYLLYAKETKSSISDLAGVTLVISGTFLYYLPALLILPILLSSNSLKIFLRRVLFILTVGVPMYLFYFLFYNYSLFVSGGASTFGFTTIPIFNILAVFTKGIISQPYTPLLSNIQDTFIILFFFVALSLPFIMKIMKLNPLLVISILYCTPFLFLPIFNWDEFIWMTPFLSISFAAYFRERHLAQKLMLTQLIFLPLLALFNMFSAPYQGQGTGIFYLTYPFFHNATNVYQFVPRYITVTAILDILNYAFILLSVYVLVRLIYVKHKENSRTIARSEEVSRKSRQMYFMSNMTNRPKFSHLTRLSKIVATNKRIMGALLIVLILFLTSYVTSLSTTELTINYTNGQFPLGLFQSNVDIMNSTVSYDMIDNGTVLYLGNATDLNVPPSIFVRSLRQESFFMNISYSPSIPLDEANNITFLGVDNYTLTLTSALHSLKPSKIDILIISLNNKTQQSIPYNSTIGVQIFGNVLTFKIDHRLIDFNGTFNNIWFGRTSYQAPGGYFKVLNLTIHTVTNNIYIGSLIILYGVPLVPLFALITETKQTFLIFRHKKIKGQ